MFSLSSTTGEPLDVDVGDGSPRETKVLSLKNVKDTFTLKNVPEGAVLSILRDFSAPVKLIIDGELQSVGAKRKLHNEFEALGIRSPKLGEVQLR